MAMKELLLVVGIIMMAVSFPVESANTEHCFRPYTKIAGYCYEFQQTKKTWSGAETTCSQARARLVSLVSRPQYNGILSHLKDNNPGNYWLSGAVRSNNWIWTSIGSRVAPAFWGNRVIPPANNESCAYLSSETARYWPRNCTEETKFICEKDTIVMQQVDNEQTGGAEVNIPEAGLEQGR